MAGLELFNVGAEQYRIGSWRGHRSVGYLVPLTPPERLSRTGLQRSLDQLTARGYTRVFTAALTAKEQRFFSQWGFRLHERLHLLQHDLVTIPPMPAIDAKLTRGHRWHYRAALEVDGRAFDGMWRLDLVSLKEAIDATPASRFRLAKHGQRVVGYAVSGRSVDCGYLQRLAVDPDVEGHGIGTALVVDCLQWAKRHGVDAVSVNTQEGNTRAFALYERLGFVPVEPGLAVLERELG